MNLRQFVLASEQSAKATAHRRAVRIAKIKSALTTFAGWLLLMVCAFVLTAAFAPIKAALAGQSSEQHIEIVRKPQPDVVPTVYK